MSRSGYSYDCENLALYRQAVENAIVGKRGQAFLRELAAALDAMPVKELVAGEIVRHDGAVCAIGSVAVARGMDVSDIDIYDGDEVGAKFNVAGALACEIAYENDECGEKWTRKGWEPETPAERWTRMRGWVEKQLRKGVAREEGGGNE